MTKQPLTRDEVLEVCRAVRARRLSDVPGGFMVFTCESNPATVQKIEAVFAEWQEKNSE